MPVGFRSLIPGSRSAIELSQAGSITMGTLRTNWNGAAGGYAGSQSSQAFVEWIAGEDCGSYTSADNTNGTFFYPEIEYFASIKNLSFVLGLSLLNVEISGKSVTGDDFVFTDVYKYYRPDLSPATNHITVYHGDEIWGKFKRLSMYNPGALGQQIRIHINKGPARRNKSKI